MKIEIKNRYCQWGLGAALLPFAIAQALAQTPAGGGASTLDTVQVTGVRSSLQKSQTLKIDAIGTVDAVSAEDVGKFPDQNVADSLQRVPGVSVDRSGGESRYITVRGFGPEFNAVTLNGRTMATEGEGREFSFDILPSELISAAEVKKTSTADGPEGSIGATVNIVTQRPLDNPGLHVAAAVAGFYDDTAKETKPKMSALISHSNADGTLGGLLSVVRSKRSHINETARTSGWLTGDTGCLMDASGGCSADGTGMQIALPRNMIWTAHEQERTRTGVNAALDWQPRETLKLAVDAMYSQYEIETHSRAVGLWTTPTEIIDITADSNGTATYFRRDTTGQLATDHTHYGDGRDSSNTQVGANLRWDVNEHTTLDVDGAWSRAKNNFHRFYMNLGPTHGGLNPTWNLNPGAFPTYTNVLPYTDLENLDLRAHVAERYRHVISDELGEFKTNLTRNFYDGALSRLKFGASASTRTKERSNSARVLGGLNNGYAGWTARVPKDMMRVYTGGNIAGSGGPTQWLTFEPEDYTAWLATEAAWGQLAPGGDLYNPNDPDRAQRIRDALALHGGGFNPLPTPENDWEVREKSYTAYAQADFEGDWGAMPWQLNVGVRYVRTDVTSNANSAQVQSVVRNPGDITTVVVNTTEPQPLSRSSSYHDWLPSVNFRLNLRDDLVLRLSASETLTRPTLTNLNVSEDVGNTFRLPGAGRLTSGNVDLQPYTSKNVDLGLEWYLNDTSYIALAGFYKNVSNFITTVTVPIKILEFDFLRTMPINGETAIIKGAEFSFQYTFDRLPSPFDGLGVQLNYTSVDSEQSFDPSIVTGQFSVVGLSDSGNLVLFYEKDRFGIRLAYNWRDEYLAAIRGDQGEPITVDAYDQIDLSTNFKITDHLSIFADATNLTGEKESNWQRYKNRVLQWSDNGRMITLGIRGSW